MGRFQTGEPLFQADTGDKTATHHGLILRLSSRSSAWRSCAAGMGVAGMLAVCWGSSCNSGGGLCGLTASHPFGLWPSRRGICQELLNISALRIPQLFKQHRPHELGPDPSSKLSLWRWWPSQWQCNMGWQCRKIAVLPGRHSSRQGKARPACTCIYCYLQCSALRLTTISFAVARALASLDSNIGGMAFRMSCAGTTRPPKALQAGAGQHRVQQQEHVGVCGSCQVALEESLSFQLVLIQGGGIAAWCRWSSTEQNSSSSCKKRNSCHCKSSRPPHRTSWSVASSEPTTTLGTLCLYPSTSADCIGGLLGQCCVRLCAWL